MESNLVHTGRRNQIFLRMLNIHFLPALFLPGNEQYFRRARRGCFFLTTVSQHPLIVQVLSEGFMILIEISWQPYEIGMAESILQQRNTG